MALTRKQIREMGVTDEEQITAILNAHKGEIEDFKEDYKSKLKQAAPAPRTEQEPKPAEQKPDPQQASAPDEVEQLRRELAAEKAKVAERDRRDSIIGALGTFKPKNADVLYKLLDHDKIVIENGAIKTGLEEQIEAFKANQSYLFADAADPKGGAEAVTPAGTFDMNSIIRGK